MRALAAERDLQDAKSASQSGAPLSPAGAKKSKAKKSKVAHVVDKMLFNYRNIGKHTTISAVVRLNAHFVTERA
jgi:hypothetical protein